jgi:hypothetical protein
MKGIVSELPTNLECRRGDFEIEQLPRRYAMCAP